MVAEKPGKSATEAPERTRVTLAESTTKSGNLTEDPELRFTPAGRAVANCSIAVNIRIKDEATGEWEAQAPVFYDVVAFGSLAEHFVESARKGTRIVITGRGEEETTVKDGKTYKRLRIVATDIGVSLMFADAEVKKSQRAGGFADAAATASPF